MSKIGTAFPDGFWTEEFINALKNLGKALEASNTINSAGMRNALASSITAIQTIDYSGLRDSLEPMEKSMAGIKVVLAEADRNLTDVAKKLANALGQNRMPDSFVMTEEIAQKVSEVLEDTDPYLPPDHRDTLENDVRPKLKEKSRLSLSDLLTIISILITLVTLFVSRLPTRQQADENQLRSQEVQYLDKMTVLLPDLIGRVNELIDSLQSFDSTDLIAAEDGNDGIDYRDNPSGNAEDSLETPIQSPDLEVQPETDNQEEDHLEG